MITTSSMRFSSCCITTSLRSLMSARSSSSVWSRIRVCCHDNLRNTTTITSTRVAKLYSFAVIDLPCLPNQSHSSTWPLVQFCVITPYLNLLRWVHFNCVNEPLPSQVTQFVRSSCVVERHGWEEGNCECGEYNFLFLSNL